ncbi:hypothetical protein GUJ93_ZPchr0001g30286 [Zizania palustris]|uniref:Uncharacterized protein n=1 Tax=Zizania palustris TaxID=103762 RepID=A0A8J5RMY5_ZIZPA|nr:hypothetical protein GUJ93_ZPchr0001g30286 [Zizania palustris]
MQAMPAVTHDDLSLRKAQDRRAARTSGRATVALVALSVLCGIVGFILCLAAEGSRSEVSYYLMSVGGAGQGQVDVCFYNSSGRAALAFAITAFLLLAVAMFAEHAYMLLAVAAPDSSAVGLAAVAEGHPRVPADPATLTWHTFCLFFVTWICFGLAEMLLMIGIGVESGHVNDWRKPRPVCHRVRPGIFAAAGILGLITVVIGFVVYVTALQTQKLGVQHPGGAGGYFVSHAAPHPGVPHGPQPHPPPPPTAPNAPEITTVTCQVQPSRATCVTKECAAVGRICS